MRFTPKKAGRTLSALLAAAMVITSIPQTGLTVHATETGGTNTPPPIITDIEEEITSDIQLPNTEEIPGTDDPKIPEETTPTNPDTPDTSSQSDKEISDEELPDDQDVPDDDLPSVPDTSDETLPIDGGSSDATDPLPLLADGETTDPATQFQVTFELSGHGEPIEPLSVDEGGKLENSEALQPTAEGFRFDGWYKDALLTEKWDFDTDTITADITLYAKWTALFTVTFDLSGHGSEIAPLTVDADSKLTETDTLKPAAEGFRFDGWYKDAQLTEKWNFDTDTITGDITLHAKWTALFTVTFDLSGHGSEIAPLTVDADSRLTETETLKPTAEGFHFEGWYKDFELTQLWNFSTDTVTANITLYAKWQEIAAGTHVVTFHLSGQGTDFFQYPVSGSKLEKPEDPQPALEGYRFAGWHKDAAYTQLWDFDNDIVTADLTLYARWEEITYTVIFDFSGNGTNITQANIKPGSLLTQTAELTPTAEGFLFLGWYKDPLYTEPWDFTKDTVNADITLYAHWQKIYTVTFNLSGKGPDIVKTGIYEGSRLTRTEDLTPVAAGFQFENWYKDQEYTQIWDFNKDTVTSDLTLYAKWEELQENQYVVTFSLSGHGENLYAYVKQGEKLKEPDEPKEDGWQFLNWYTSEEYVEAWDFQHDTVETNLTLYARWAQLTSLQVESISPQTFTGKAIKPSVSVYYSTYNEEGTEIRTTLRANKDYKVSYQNNINTNAYVQAQAGSSWEEGDTLAGGSNSTGAKVAGGFNPALPHIIIEGKGNYRGTLYMNFEITQVPISNEDGTVAAGITLACNDQFPLGKPNKDQKTITSFKYKKNTLKENVDYTASIEGAEATGSTISKDDPIFDKEAGGGDCTLTITGKGNYTGTIVRTIISREKNTLLKNAKITLGSKCKSKRLDAEDGEVTLIPAYQETVEEEKWDDKNDDYFYDKNGDPVMVKKTYYYQYIGGDWITSYEVYDEKKDDYVTKKLDKNNAFTVKLGSNWLKYGDDYDIVYANNTSVGTATMTIVGKGSYTGSKSVNFKITGASGGNSGGKKFSADTIKISGWTGKMTYTGGELTQSDLSLETKKSSKIYDCGMSAGEVEDEWEDDNGKIHYVKHKHTSECYHKEVEHAFDESEYTVTYKNNTRVGTATAIFTANPESGYSGSFKKTFKITAINVAEFVTFSTDGETLEPSYTEKESNKTDEDGEPITIYTVNKTRTMEGTVPYVKSGATLQFNLSSELGTLELNKDYAISYKNNKSITPMKKWRDKWKEEDENGKMHWVYGEEEMVPNESKMGVLVIKGKGNYSGTLNIKYQIVQGTMDTDNAIVTVARSAYSASTKEYKPKVTVWTPNAGYLSSKEYSVTYSNNKKDAVAAYLNGSGEAPSATVTLSKNNNYSNLCDEKDEDGTVTKYEPIELAPVTMEFYPNKLTAKNLYIIIDNENPKELVYTGKQVTNVRARVYFGSDAAVKAAKKDKVTNNRLLTATDGSYGLIRLTESPKDADGAYTGEGDYTISYGKNNAIGKNKGTITINGAGIYGGSVNQKFTIYQNPVYYSVVSYE